MALFDSITSRVASYARSAVISAIDNLKSGLGISDSISSWSIIDDQGQRAVAFDVMINFDITAENKVIQSPTEMGNFVMYNKVVTPNQIGLQVAIMGDSARLQEALNILFQLQASTDLISVISPEYEYQNYNLEKMQYQRAAEKGIDVIYVDLGFIEVREATVQYSNARIAKRVKRGKQTNGNESALHGLMSWIKS